MSRGGCRALLRDTGFRRTLAQLYLPAVFVLGLGLFAAVAMTVRDERMALDVSERSRVDVASDRLMDRLDGIVSDLMVLAEAPSTVRFAATGNPYERQRMAELYAAFAREKGHYDQVRYLNAAGMEIVRINFIRDHAIIVPDRELQNKSDRYYFRQAIGLRRGQLYLSPLDLNVERGAIEIPHKPMLRLATPVTDAAGTARGIVVLNLLGGEILDDFRDAMHESPSPMLLNRDGYWLSNPDPSRDWSFMFASDQSFARSYADVWAVIQKRGKGIHETEAGIFFFAPVYPAASRLRQPQPPAPGPRPDAGPAVADYVWYIVSFIPAGQAPALALNQHPLALLIFCVGSIALAWLACRTAEILAERTRVQAAIASRERQLREITAALGVGVLVLDRHGHLTYSNPEAERLLGWTGGELMARNAHEAFHQSPTTATDATSHAPTEPLHCAVEPCRILQALHDRTPYRSEQEIFYRRDRDPIPVEVSCHPLLRDDGQPGLVVAFQNIAVRKAAADRIEHLAYYDTLTDLPNRRMLLDRLNGALRQAVRHERALALLFLDLDYFKQINDSLGHGVGDELLKEVGVRLRRCVRQEDTVSRQGGDEFVILLPEIAHPNDAGLVAQKIIEEVQKPILIDGHSLTVSTSIGISIFPIHGTDNATELMKKADIAMYAAKAAGRNGYCYFDRENSPTPPLTG